MLSPSPRTNFDNIGPKGKAVQFNLRSPAFAGRRSKINRSNVHGLVGDTEKTVE